MPAAIKLDTLKFAKRLTSAGMDQRQAEAIVEGLSEADTSELATKADLLATKDDLKAEIAEVKDDISDLKATMAEMKAEIFRFMYLQAAGIVGITVALIKLLP